MLPGKLLITGVLATLIIGGCVQKKPQSRKNTTVTTKSLSKPVLKDTTDIFDEFYKDEAATKTPAEKSVGNETFSTMPSVKKSVSAQPGQFSEGGRYVLQVSTIKSKRLADRMATQLEGMGFPSYVCEVTDPTPDLPGTYYRVRVGGFTSIFSARSFGETTLRDAGYDFWVDNRSNDNIGMSGSGMGSGGAGYSSSPESYSGSSTYTTTETSSQYTPEPAAVIPEPPVTQPVTPEPVAPTPAATPDAGSIPDTTGWDSAW